MYAVSCSSSQGCEDSNVKSNSDLIKQFEHAKVSSSLVVLEGFHTVKHALRFDAELLVVLSAKRSETERMVAALAPDIAQRLNELIVYVDPEVLKSLVDAPHATGVVAIARRPRTEASDVLGGAPNSPIVALENPRQLSNVGACIRVAAAAGCAGVLTIGDIDPWHPHALRGSAGLHFALPVAQTQLPIVSERPLIAVDPEGELFDPDRLPENSVLAFGTERYGLSDRLLVDASARVALPMVSGVSSLNLATSVAAVLYSWKLSSNKRVSSNSK